MYSYCTFSRSFKALMACVASAVPGVVLFTMFWRGIVCQDWIKRHWTEHTVKCCHFREHARTHTHTWTSSFILVILWNGRTRKERRGSLWQTGLLSNFSTIRLNPGFSFLKEKRISVHWERERENMVLLWLSLVPLTGLQQKRYKTLSGWLT